MWAPLPLFKNKIKLYFHFPNDDAEFDEEEYAVHKAERPPGRDKSKKERAKGKEKEKVDPKMEEFMEHLKTYNDVSTQKTKAKERAVEEKTRVAEEKLRKKVRLSNEKIRISDEKIRLKEWEIIMMDVDAYPEPKRSMLKKLQTDIMKKHDIIYVYVFFIKSFFLLSLCFVLNLCNVVLILMKIFC
ncbi:hypothetical protein HanIR_Chr06g0260141 [Helianthus annuus]|nr:hypothetical protein HanIR_Chr06g0260141 [Helianthus annuus]